MPCVLFSCRVGSNGRNIRDRFVSEGQTQAGSDRNLQKNGTPGYLEILAHGAFNPYRQPASCNKTVVVRFASNRGPPTSKRGIL